MRAGKRLNANAARDEHADERETKHAENLVTWSLCRTAYDRVIFEPVRAAVNAMVLAGGHFLMQRGWGLFRVRCFVFRAEVAEYWG